MPGVTDVPAGFVPIDAGAGYGERFGPVYVNRPACRLAFRVAPYHLNPVGGLHGGALATFADMLLIAFRERADDGPAHNPTISLAIDFMAPVAEKSWVVAEIALLKETRALLFTQSILTVAGEPVARVAALYRNRKITGVSA